MCINSSVTFKPSPSNPAVVLITPQSFCLPQATVVTPYVSEST